MTHCAAASPLTGFRGEALNAFPLFRSSDPEQTQAEVARVFCPHELRQLNQRKPFTCRHNMVKLGETALNFLTYGTDVLILPGALENFYLVQLPLDGVARIRSGSETVESTSQTAVILNPDEEIEMRWSSDSAQLLLWIPRKSIERRVSELLCDDLRVPLRFDVQLQQSAGLTSAWCTMVKDLARNIDNNGVDWLRFRPAASALEDCLIRGLIFQQGHNYSAQLMKPPPVAQSRHLQRAIDHIEGSALESLTVADIASRAHISVRALEEGFRKHYNTTPLIYLRNKRLDLVRQAILANAQAGSPETITKIAFRHGFNHLGRFSAYYRERIGESPSDTARASGGVSAV